MTLQPVEFVLRKNVTNEQICENLRANAGRPLPSVDFKRVAICASGPSLADHLDTIRACKAAGFDIAAMNGSHNYLLENGIVPDFMFMIDSRPVNLPFLDRANDHTTYVIASQCRPEVFEALEGRKVLLWQVHNYDGADDVIRELAPGHTVFLGAQNVGQSCLGPLLAMGYRTWFLFGYDASMRGSDKHAFTQPQNASEEVQEFKFPLSAEGSEIEGVTKTYLATPTMAHHAETFVDRYNAFRKLGVEIRIFGGGLLPDMVRLLGIDGVTINATRPDFPAVPAPVKRAKPVERLPIVSFKWKGHIPYSAKDVDIWANMVDRHLERDHELICITDDAEGIDGRVRTIPMWRDHFEHGRDWHRLRLFSEEMADLIGPRFVVMDLDTVICGPLDPLFENEAPFKAWADPNRPYQYCTALFQMDAGAFPHVIDTFDVKKAMKLRNSGQFVGYDQAWISYVLSGQPRWTAEDGVLSFRTDFLKGREIYDAPRSAMTLPFGAKVVNFHGKHNPRDEAVLAAIPWVSEHYR